MVWVYLSIVMRMSLGFHTCVDAMTTCILSSCNQLFSTSRASLKLAYKDLSMEDQRRDEVAKKMDPKKAEQLERLGMAYGGSSK